MDIIGAKGIMMILLPIFSQFSADGLLITSVESRGKITWKSLIEGRLNGIISLEGT